MSDDIHPHAHPEHFADLPIQPTGSGVQDLEIAYEQMALATDGEPIDPSSDLQTERAASPMTIPTEETDAAADSAAHPS